MGRPLALLVIAIAIAVIATVGFAVRPGVVIAAGLVAVGVVLVLMVVRLAGRGERSAQALPVFARPEAASGAAAPLLEAVERTSADRLRLLAVRPLDRAAHSDAREEALDAVAARGRGPALEVSRAWIVDFVDRSFGTRGFDPTFIGLAWRHEPLTAQDRARVAETLSDAAIAVLARDTIGDAAFDELIGPCADLLDDADR